MNINDAAKDLPERIRLEFFTIWKAINCMDLYDGRLESYFIVIRQEVERIKEKLEQSERTLQDIQKIAGKFLSSDS